MNRKDIIKIFFPAYEFYPGWARRSLDTEAKKIIKHRDTIEIEENRQVGNLNSKVSQL